MENDDQNHPVVPKSPQNPDNLISGVRADRGDVFIGSKYSINIDPPKIDPNVILTLVQQYKDLDSEDPKFIAIKEELDEYNLPRQDRPIVGLKGKLKAGERIDLVPDAVMQKDKFAKRLSRYEFSAHHCAIHLNLLSRIEERFNARIRPIIEGGAPSEAVDHAISELIIEPLSHEVSPADPTITAKIVRGMLFLLTGNCYLKWSNDDLISPS